MKKAYAPLLLLPFVLLALLLGLGTGLARLGWAVDPFSQEWQLNHGAFMLNAFLGTLISLERATALAGINRAFRWAYLVPAINLLAGLFLLMDSHIAHLLFVLSSLGLLVLFGFMLRQHPAHYVFIMALGAAAWAFGNGLWLTGKPLYLVVHSWIAFLLLTIVGERLELSRIMRLKAWQERLLMLCISIFVLGILLTPLELAMGIRIAGLGSLSMAVWLLTYDLSRRTIRQQDLPRYIAFCLLPGYVWLGMAGLIALWKGAVYAGLDYEALLHAYLLGFVFSMIFGHAPIILPAVTGLQLNYSPLFYGHLILLHTALAYRIYGCLSLDFTARHWGGLLNVAAILLFMLISVWTILRSKLKWYTRDKAIDKAVEQ